MRTGAGGHTVLILFYDCSGDSCGSIQSMSATGRHRNSRSRSSIGGIPSAATARPTSTRRARDLRFEYDIDLRGGVSAGSIKQGLLLYEGMLARLDEFIWAAPAAPETAAPVPGALGEIAGKARER